MGLTHYPHVHSYHSNMPGHTEILISMHRISEPDYALPSGSLIIACLFRTLTQNSVYEKGKGSWKGLVLCEGKGKN